MLKISSKYADQLIVSGACDLQLYRPLRVSAHQPGIIDDAGRALQVADLDHHQSDKDHQNQHKAALQDADEIFAIYFYISFYHNDLDHGTTMIFFIANQS